MPIINISKKQENHIINSSLTLGDYGIISGRKNQGKTTFAYQLACDIAFGATALDGTLPVSQNRKTLYVSCEYGESIIPCNDGYDALHLTSTSSDQFKLLTDEDADFSLFQDDFFGFLKKYINLGYEVFFIDNISFLRKYTHNNESKRVRLGNEDKAIEFIDTLKTIIKDSACVIFLQHTTKSGATRGSARLTDHAKLYWKLKTNENSIEVENEGKVKLQENTFQFSCDVNLRYVFRLCDFRTVEKYFPYIFLAGSKSQLTAFIQWYTSNYSDSPNYIASIYEEITRENRGNCMYRSSYEGRGFYWLGKALLACRRYMTEYAPVYLDNLCKMHPLFNCLAGVDKLVEAYNAQQDDDKLKLESPIAMLNKAADGYIPALAC